MLRRQSQLDHNRKVVGKFCNGILHINKRPSDDASGAYHLDAYDEDEEVAIAQLHICPVIRDLIFEYLLPEPVDLVKLVDGPFNAIEVIPHNAGFIVQPEPSSLRTMVRADICAPTDNGNYYYELQLAEDVTSRQLVVDAVGWCDSQRVRVDEQKQKWRDLGYDEHSWAFRGSARKFYNDEALSDEFEFNKFEFNNAWLAIESENEAALGDEPELEFDNAWHAFESENIPEIPPPQSPLRRADSAKKSCGVPYGQRWEAGDVVGCGITLTKGKFKIMFFLNGEEMGVAWEDCTYVERLFPACLIDGPAGHQMVFGRESLRHLPNGFEPLYVMR